MISYKFSNWISWNKRNELSKLKYPGVYCLAVSTQDLSSMEFHWISEIKYIGMTNSQGGLKIRLKQFNNTIFSKKGHGGGDRFLYKHRNYSDLVKKLYVSILPFECNVRSNKPYDLRMMGEVAKYEYECFAKYVEKFGRLPEFNDKKRSPKYKGHLSA
jgi:hypothetical protein